MKNRDIYWRRYKIQETLYTGQRRLGPLQHWDLTQFSQSPSAAPSYFPESQWWFEILSLWKGILVLGKARSCRVQNLGFRGLSHLGDLMFLQNTLHETLMHETVGWAHCCVEAASPQLPISVAFWISWIVSPKECSSLMQTLMQIHCSAHSVILNVTTTQYTCSLGGICCPHWLVQWSPHCSHVHIPVHSPWLPGYINVTQNVLVILTMAGLFLDRTHVYHKVIYILSI